MTLSAEKRALIERMLEARKKKGPPSAIPPKAARTGPRPLSPSEERLWFLEALDPGTASYHIRRALRIEGPLDPAILERSLRAIIDRHQPLRTGFLARSGEPIAMVHPSVPFELARTQIEAGGDRAATLRSAIDRELRRPFALDRPPLFRAALFVLGAREHVLVLSFHHLVADGWSLGVFFQELAEIYIALLECRAPAVSPLLIQYGDYVLWQKDAHTKERLDAEIAYWRARLFDRTALELPIARPRPETTRSSGQRRGARRSIAIPRAPYDALDALGQREGATPFMVLISAFDVLLHRYSEQTDIAVGTPAANRSAPDLFGLIGCFINTLVLRIDLSGDPTFRDLLARTKETALDAYANQDVPFESVVRALAPQKRSGESPFFEVLFALQNTPKKQVPELSGLSVEPVEIDPGTAHVDLSLSLEETPRALTATLEYDADRFDAAAIERFLEHYHRLLEAAAADPDRPISKLALLSPTEEETLTVRWNRTDADFPKDLPLHALFEAEVDRAPERIAIEIARSSAEPCVDAEAMTYGALERVANRIAHRLRALGAGPDVPIGLLCDRSLHMPAGILGILKAGAAYSPLDPAYPKALLDFMIEDSGMSIVLTAGAAASELARELKPGVRAVALDSPSPELLGEPDARPPRSGAGAESLAYLIYTSGSTGKPKGVEVPHRAVVNFLSSMKRSLEIGPTDVLLAVTTLSFDIAGLEMHLPLAAGAKVAIASREIATDGALLAGALRASKATMMQATPATWRLLLSAGWSGAPGLAILCGGEALDEDLARQLAVRGRALFNLYGPTETTIWSTIERVGPAADSRPSVSIGRPIANTELYVLDAHGAPVPIGIPGELFIGGAGVARGYHRQARLTEERFAAHPGLGAKNKLYRTGDRVRWLEDGRLEFLGRADQQVKLRGFRIELLGIEAALLEDEEIREAAVAIREDRLGDKHLVAYCVPTGEAPISPARLRSHLLARLPEHMIPSVFLELDALPRMPNGKIDRSRLPAPDLEADAPGRSWAPPKSEIELALASIFSEVVGRPSIGLFDDFFELGGHSLLAAQVVVRIRERLLVQIPLRAMFDAPTIAGLAARIEPPRSDAKARTIERQSRCDGPIPLSFAQQRIWFLHLLEGESGAYNIPFALRIFGRLEDGPLQKSLDEIVRRHEGLRTVFPLADGHPVQVIEPLRPVPIARIDLSSIHQPEKEIDRLMQKEAKRPFDLERGPLFRITRIDLGDDETVLFLSIHHIAADGWVLQATPATYRLLLAAGWKGSRDLRLLIGGEAVPEELAALLSDRGRELWIMYGPTETTVWSAVRRLERGEPKTSSGVVPIGGPIANTEFYILDPKKEPVPIGVAGELWIGGHGLAKGYLRQDPLTEERFARHPFHEEALLYRTGDRARWLSDGRIEFLGRADDQVKIRGFRVELEEIASVLREHPAIAEAAVVAREDRPGDQRLAAYVVAKDVSPAFAQKELFSLLEERLPEYMRPAALVQLDALPRTPNGKIDRRRLPAPGRGDHAVKPKHAPPRDAIEAEIAQIWEKVLGTSPIGIHDSFFELGGQSLLAIELLDRLERAFQKGLTLMSVFRGPTVAEIAALVRGASYSAPWRALSVIQAKGDRPPLYFVGSVGYAHALAPSLGADQPLYGLNVFGLQPDDNSTPAMGVGIVARRYVDEIRSHQPFGAYHLAGYCADAKVAFEMALQLREAGEEVGLLAFIDVLWRRTPANHRVKHFMTLLRDFGTGFLLYRLKRRVAFLIERLTLWLASIYRRFRRETADVLPVTLRNMVLIRSFFAELAAYRPKPYDGPIALILSRESRLKYEPEASAITSGRLDVHEVPGYHDNLFVTPQVETLGACLRKCLDDVNQGRQPAGGDRRTDG